jgi:hypothetical protein
MKGTLQHSFCNTPELVGVVTKGVVVAVTKGSHYLPYRRAS